MKNKLILSITLIILFRFSFLSSPASINERGNTQVSVKPRAYIGWVVKYFHQYQTRATGNWAPSLHGLDASMKTSTSVMAMQKMDILTLEQLVVQLGLLWNINFLKITVFGKSLKLDLEIFVLNDYFQVF